MAPAFEQMLAHCGFSIIKYYLDVSRKEQKRRLAERSEDPLMQWKRSSVDVEALRLWKEYGDARDEMLNAPAYPMYHGQ